MAAARSYRDDLQRPHCGSNWLPKDGRSRGKQTYRCRLCHYRFTPDGNRHYYSEQVKEQAIDMYGEGMAIAAISRVLEVKLGTVYEWVKKVQWALGIWAWVTMQRQRWGIVPAISFDEMWTYQRARRGKKRQEVWIWTAVIELPDGRRCVDFEVGDRSGETFLRLYERLPEAEWYYSDDYGVYGSWLPAERHIVGKGKLANRNEGLHSEYRGRLKRLARATTGYTKQVWVLRGSLALLCLRPRRGQKSDASAC